MKKPTTHKIITGLVHISCFAAAVYIFAVWQRGTVTDAAQMLQYVAWVEITNLAQYSGKSAYDHKHGIFDNPIAQAAVQAMQSNDMTYGPGQITQAVQQAEPPTDGDNNNIAG